MPSINQVAAERARAVERLVFEADLKTSQWIHASPYQSVFCIAVKAKTATWKIEGQLPNGTVIPLGCYRREECHSRIFNPKNNRYIKEEVMCGLPIRFVSTVEQPDSELWVVMQA